MRAKKTFVSHQKQINNRKNLYKHASKKKFRIIETVTITSEGCGIKYKKEEKNGNVRRYNSSESLSEELVA